MTNTRRGPDNHKALRATTRQNMAAAAIRHLVDNYMAKYSVY
jgi:hypothetical protein